MHEDSIRTKECLLVRLQRRAGALVSHESDPHRAPGRPAEPAVFDHLGDMQLRFVFDVPEQDTTCVALWQDLERLQLTPAAALQLALHNLRRVWGRVEVVARGEGLQAVQARHATYAPSLLLDRDFWRQQLQRHPRGLLAALPGGRQVLFAAAGDPRAEQALVQAAQAMLANTAGSATSLFLYRFDAGGWQFHGPIPRPAPPKPLPPLPADAPAVVIENGDLPLAARGQRMLVFSILGAFVLNALEHGFRVGDAWLLPLTAALTCYSLLGVARIGSGLGRSTGARIVYMVLSCVPLVSIVTWLVLSVQSTRALRAGGFRVGLLGARM